VVIFWLIFPGLNAWAGGHPYEHIDIVCDVMSLPFLVAGIAVFRFQEKKHDNPTVIPLNA
jgi:hypothetical protein